MKHLQQPLLLSTLLGAVALTGCVSSSTSIPVRLAELRATALPNLSPTAPSTAGATANDTVTTRRAQWVGDTVSIRVTSKGAAKARTASTPATSASTSSAASATSMALATQAQSLMAAQQGMGDSESARTFYATVTDVLPNGHLVVSREKLISSTQSMDLLRFTATIDPRTLQSDNVVSSAALASMRLESSEGELPASGLSRFLLSPQSM